MKQIFRAKVQMMNASLNSKRMILMIFERHLFEINFNFKMKANPYLPNDLKPIKIRKMQFHEPGFHIAEAKKARKLTRLQQLSQSVERRFNEEDRFILSLAKEPAPKIEWWDEAITSQVILDSKIYHFPPMAPAAPLPVAELKPVMLTKKEARKLRRQRRLEAQKEKREKIRLGLLPPEESKLKMSNFMKVLGQKALEEPTRAEALVRKQIKARLKKHEQANLERSLSAEERRKKTIEHWKQIGAGTLSAGSMLIQQAAILTPSLGAKEKFKLMVNGSQFQLHGLVIKLPEKGLVVVEGSLRAITHYKKLLLSRMQWPEPPKLLWQGTASKLAFTKLKWCECSVEAEARSLLKAVNMDHLLKTAVETESAIPAL